MQGIVLTALYVVIGMIMLKGCEATKTDLDEDMKMWVLIFWPVAVISIITYSICILVTRLFGKTHQDE